MHTPSLTPNTALPSIVNSLRAREKNVDDFETEMKISDVGFFIATIDVYVQVRNKRRRLNVRNEFQARKCRYFLESGRGESMVSPYEIVF